MKVYTKLFDNSNNILELSSEANRFFENINDKRT